MILTILQFLNKQKIKALSYYTALSRGERTKKTQHTAGEVHTVSVESFEQTGIYGRSTLNEVGSRRADVRCTAYSTESQL